MSSEPDLFGAAAAGDEAPSDSVLPPLAVRMRPRSLDEVRGQSDVLRVGSPLRRLIEGSGGRAGPVSAILWGPPGTGKTTLAHLVASAAGRDFVELSAITAGVKDVRSVMEQAARNRDLYEKQTVLFLDEIHRFTKAQQDALLPGVENRQVILVAATTENPSFSVIAPLLSRSVLITLTSLSDNEIRDVVEAALTAPSWPSDPESESGCGLEEGRLRAPASSGTEGGAVERARAIEGLDGEVSDDGTLPVAGRLMRESGVVAVGIRCCGVAAVERPLDRGGP